MFSSPSPTWRHHGEVVCCVQVHLFSVKASLRELWIVVPGLPSLTRRCLSGGFCISKAPLSNKWRLCCASTFWQASSSSSSSSSSACTRKTFPRSSPAHKKRKSEIPLCISNLCGPKKKKPWRPSKRRRSRWSRLIRRRQKKITFPFTFLRGPRVGRLINFQVPGFWFSGSPSVFFWLSSELQKRRKDPLFLPQSEGRSRLSIFRPGFYLN